MCVRDLGFVFIRVNVRKYPFTAVTNPSAEYSEEVVAKKLELSDMQVVVIHIM